MFVLDFNNIRHLNGSANDGFEEFVCQLAHKETVPNSKQFARNGKPDGGIECYWILEDCSIVAWQAKYFCKAFEDSQYQQIDRSVKEALSSHPDLRRYIIAVPIDPPDAHTTGRMSMKERINGYIVKWSKIRSDVSFEFWWASDMIERLQNPSNQGLVRFWFGKHEFTDANLMQFNADSIKDLGKRYTPKLNVNVETIEYFRILSRGESLNHFIEKVTKQAEEVCEKVEKNKNCHEAIDKVKSVRKAIKQINETNLNGIDRIPIEESLEPLKSLGETIQDIANDIVRKEKAEEVHRYSHGIYDLGIDILRVYNKLHQDIIRLINDPILILDGDAGVGKSHLMADVVLQREKEKQLSLLFLGQKFITDEDPFTQMMRMLYFSGSSDEFLEMLEAKAETTGHRIIIFIDAINEGHGLTIWQNNIRSFINKIRQHPWLGLVLSIRTSYIDAILPCDEFKHDYCVRAKHFGFGNNTHSAVQLYFKEYDILYPSVPLLNPEFRNPLFLHLFCEGMKNNGYRKIPNGIKGISSVMRMFFDGIEKNIRKEKQYSSSITCVDKAVRKYIEYTAKNNLHEMHIDKAIESFSEIYPRIFKDGELFDYLVSEGVFSKNVFCNRNGKYEEFIYFTYERFENTLLAEYLIDELKFDDKTIEKYIRKSTSPYVIGGLLESLAILLPELKGQELYELLPNLYSNKVVIKAVIYSLTWREKKTIDLQLDKYFTEFIADEQIKEYFIRTIIENSFKAENHYNASYLHKMLASMNLSDRDAMWIPILYRIYNTQDNIVEHIINWTWDESNKVNLDESSVELGATLLSWFLASTNRKLRDTATKALIQLLHNRMQLLIPLLEKFSAVDDPYIHERLFSVAFGCAVRSKSKEHLANLCQYIYSSVFNIEGEVYPHILLRDYAREIIEYAISIGEKFNIDVNKIRPPYNSSFNYDTVSDEEIKAIFEECIKDNKSSGMYDMLTSMFTEHTTIGFSYGDFGRYTFQSALSNWNVNAEYLSNIAIKLIIDKYGYQEKKHGAFDLIIGSGRGRSTIPNERIGKKYQWLVLHELLARIADNFPKKQSWFDNPNANDYHGPWEPMIRDIDPTMITRVSEFYNDKNASNDFWWCGGKYANWGPTMCEWLNIEDDVPLVEPIIELIDHNGDDWYALECYPEWDEPHNKDSVYKKLWYQIRSCIVDEKDFSFVYEWASKQNFGGRWMPECYNKYELFYREYYWSPAYKYYDTEGLTKRKIYDKKTGQFIAYADVTTIGFLWEAEGDYSNKRSFYSLVPSKQLFDGMKMKHAEKEAVFLNEEGKTICFDAGIIENSKNHLLIRKDILLDYLKTHHKKIMWYVLGEKNIIGAHNYRGLPDWLVISGTYTLDDNGKVIGCLKTSNIRQ